MGKTAIVTGVSGQDGAYLSQLLVSKGYTVVGIVRSFEKFSDKKLSYLGIANKVVIEECHLENKELVMAIVNKYKPVEIYNLAAQSSVSLSFQKPRETMQFNIISVINLLEAIRTINPAIRFYQASSSEMFGKVNDLPITENSLLHPLSPYAISKVTGHQITINYRESYQLFACCGILFNHESYLRDDNFFFKKLMHGALDIHFGNKEYLEFGNLHIKRDFGYSKDYVEAMWLMLQQEKPEEFLICSGTSITLQELVEYVFEKLGIPTTKIIINPELFRPTEIEDIYGSNQKAIELLRWKTEPDFFKIADKLLEEEKTNYAGKR
jgi:GDPmannose 4,6-dehydratase